MYLEKEYQIWAGVWLKFRKRGCAMEKHDRGPVLVCKLIAIRFQCPISVVWSSAHKYFYDVVPTESELNGHFIRYGNTGSVPEFIKVFALEARGCVVINGSGGDNFNELMERANRICRAQYL